MKGEIIDIATYTNEYEQRSWRITIEVAEKPTELHLGNCEVKQNGNKR